LNTKIKICGIRSPEIALYCADLGVRYIGIIFCKESPRFVDLETAQQIALTAQNAGSIPVAVFSDANADTIIETCLATKITHVQLHGDLARDALPQLPSELTKIYVLSFDNDKSLPIATQHLDYLCNDDFFLLDSLQGGSGRTINWNTITLPKNLPFFLAGGLKATNVRTAINVCHPYAVDVSSGVEISPGVKSKQLIDAFILTVNEVANV
jgi:phosphoribosylanthranilate isomerase